MAHLHQVQAGDAVDVDDWDGEENVAPFFDCPSASVKMFCAVDVRLLHCRGITAQSYLIYRDLGCVELELNRDYTEVVSVPERRNYKW